MNHISNIATQSIKCVNALLENDATTLHDFCQDMLALDYDYIIYASDRCFCLIEAFLQAYPDMRGQENLSRTIIGSAIHCYAPEIAAHYAKSKQLPRIAIVTDLMFHGATIAKLLLKLEHLILSNYLCGIAELMNEEAPYLREDLAQTVDIFAYAVTNQPLLLPDRYLSRISTEKYLYAKDLRQLLLNINETLNALNIPRPGTTALSVLLPEITSWPEWTKYQWKYRGIQYNLAFHDNASSQLIPILRTHSRQFGVKLNWLSCTVLSGAISPHDLETLCAELIRILDPLLPQKSAVRRILSYEQPEFQTSRMELISLVLSAAYLNEFISSQQLDIPLDRETTNLLAVTRKLAFSEPITSELETVFKEVSLPELHSRIAQALPHYTEPLLDGPLNLNDQWHYEKIRREVNLLAEDIFYEAAMNNEEKLYALQRQAECPTDIPEPELLVRAFLNGLTAKSHTEFPPTAGLSCMMSLVDYGLAELRYNLVDGNISPVFVF